MGTRSLIRFNQDGKEIACIYQQFDGYPSAVGATLAEFLKSGDQVNGIRVGGKGKVFNGMGCMAAQFVAENKDGAGGLYLYAPGSTDCGEEYVYQVNGGFDRSPLNIKCTEMYEGKTLFDGDVDGFLEFCTTPEEVAE